MRKKVIASIILIIMLWQSFGNLCIAFTNSADESDDSTQETNNVVASSVNEADDKAEANEVVSDNKTETENVAINGKAEDGASNDKTEANNTESSDDESEIDNTVGDSKVKEDDTVSSEDKTKAENVSQNTNIEIGDQYITEDDLLYSNKYLVKDKVVSRIDPQTTILEFKQRVEVAKGNELSFFKKDGTTQLTEGILGTGMIVRGTNGQEYRLSIKGDMTGEGEANQVELTMMIRHLIELQGWILTDINAASGDITGDGEINLVDINKMIKHIVFGDWEYDDRTTPNPPTIEIVGREGKEADLYTSEVRVRIVEDKSTQNLKTTYKLSGKVEKEESSIEENEEIKITEDGEYLITAYTYGIQGNRSKASNRKIVISKIDEPDEPEKPDEPGVYNITYELNGGVNNSENPSTYTYGTETIFKDPTKEGNTFEGWYREAEFTNKIEKIEATQTGDITVYAKWKQNEYQITGEAKEGGIIENAEETVKYGENSTKQIIITPNRNMVVDSITVNGVKVTQYEEDEETGVVTLPIFKNVTEDKHVIAIFRQLEIVAIIIDAPAGYENLIGREYISIKRALKDVTTDGVTIQLVANTKEEFTLTNYQVTLDLNGKNVTGEGTTAIIESGSLTLINSSTTQGKIISNTGCAVYVKNGGTFNFGQNEGNVQTDIMLIQGNTIGVNNEGIFNFYDGTISGTTAIKGDVDETPLRYNASVTTNGNQQVATLKVMAGAEAAIGSKTFFKLEEAIAYANEKIATDGSQVEITVIKEIQKTETVEIPESKNIKIDLNGYEVNLVNGEDGIVNNGKLELINSKDTGRITTSMKRGIVNNEIAELTLTSGIIEVTIVGTSSFDRIAIDNTGILTINGGDVKAINNDNIGINNSKTGVMNINGGSITGNVLDSEGAIKDSSIMTTTITGGIVNGLISKMAGELMITGGTTSDIKATGKTTVTVAGGTTSDIETEEETIVTVTGGSTGEISNSSGTVTVTGGSTGGISNSSGTVTVTGGTVTSDSQGIYNFAGLVTVKGGKITGKTGIGNWTGTIKVEGGTISGDTGIRNESTGIITIGENDGNVSIESPEITGINYGVVNRNGTLNFYDGKIIGAAGRALDGTINNIEENYSIKQSIENSIETLQLAMMGNFRIVETNMTYYKLKDAIDAINLEEQTIEVIEDVIISMDEVDSISSGKSVILDLNGKKIENPAILNYGILKIVDSSEDKTGIISLNGESGIANEANATLIIAGGEILLCNTDSAIGIKNSGTLTLEGGSIEITYSNSYGIYNNSTGSVEMTGGKIGVSSYSTGIYNIDGTLIVKGGEIVSADTYACGIGNSGTTKIEGGNITLIGDSSKGISNGGILDVEEGNIMGKDGIYNIGQTTVMGGTISGQNGINNTTSTSTLTVIGGTIEGTGWTGSCYGILNEGTTVIGEKDGNINIEDPKIIGKNVGVFSSKGIVNFYDGSITGPSSISASINDIEELSEIIKTVDEETNVQTAILQKKSSFDVINTTSQVGYYSLEEAIEEAQEGEILQILKDIIILGIQNPIEIETDKSVVIDLNGYNIDLGKEKTIINNGILVIEDNTIAKEGSIKSSSGSVIINETDATLEISGGTITCNNDTAASCIQNKGILKVEEGKIQGGDSGIYNSLEGEVTILDGYISGRNNVIYNDSIGAVTIDGGEIVSKGGNGIYNNLSGTVRMTGATIQLSSSYSYAAHSSYGIYNNSTGKIIIEGGDITVTENVSKYNDPEGTSGIHSTCGIYNNSTGTITIEEGNITAIMDGYTVAKNESYHSYGIYNSSTGIVTIAGGNISSSNSIYITAEVDKTSTGVYNASTGTVIIKGGNVEGDNGIYNASTGVVTVEEGCITGDSMGINNYATGTIIVKGGTISSDATAISNVGIKINFGISSIVSGTVVIGEKDGDVSIENPKIIGKEYGIYSNSNRGGIINYYDGSITGAINQSIYDVINDMEENHDIIKTVDEEANTETASLGEKVVEVVNLTSGEEYTTLRSAIEEAQEGETLQIIRNIAIIGTQSSIEIEAEKNIIIDLNGYNIEFGQENPIINNGTLKIEDRTIDQAGTMRSSSGNTITNKAGATLEIVGGLISANENGIYNEGMLKLDGGNVIGSTAIYNSLEGKVELVDGVISGSINGIYSNSTGTVLVKGGNIETTNTYSNGILNASTGKVEMLGGTIIIQKNNSEGIENYSTGMVTMAGGTITSTGTSSKGIKNNGTLLVTGGNVEGGINNSSKMTVLEGNITGGISNSRIVNSRRWKYYRGKRNIFFFWFSTCERRNYNRNTLWSINYGRNVDNRRERW